MKLQKSRILDNFIQMIRLKTVSDEGCTEEPEAFGAFRELLKSRYREVFEAGEYRLIGKRGMLLRLPGKRADRPTVLMAHYDVVPAEQEGWTVDPFGGECRDGRIYGRGTLDTKSTLCAILEAARYCILNGVRLRQDLYLSFGGEEEIDGTCCAGIVSYLKERGVRPDLVLDEGGSVIPEGLPGVRRTAAMIGVAEKGTANYRISIRDGSGGHASTPPRHTVIGRIAKAAVEIEANPFPARLSSPVRLMFRELAAEVPFYERPVFSRPELFEPAISAAAPWLGETFNAMVRSTQAVTVMEEEAAFNVLPDRAAIGVNVRLLEGDTTESAAARLRSVISDPDARVELLCGSDPTPVSPIDCEAWQTLKAVIRETWPGAVTAPYQMNGGTDARFYGEIAEHIYRFSPMLMTKAERKSVHGVDESIAVENLLRAVAFYIRLMERL